MSSISISTGPGANIWYQKIFCCPMMTQRHMPTGSEKTISNIPHEARKTPTRQGSGVRLIYHCSEVAESTLCKWVSLCCFGENTRIQWLKTSFSLLKLPYLEGRGLFLLAQICFFFFRPRWQRLQDPSHSQASTTCTPTQRSKNRRKGNHPWFVRFVRCFCSNMSLGNDGFKTKILSNDGLRLFSMGYVCIYIYVCVYYIYTVYVSSGLIMGLKFGITDYPIPFHPWGPSSYSDGGKPPARFL